MKPHALRGARAERLQCVVLERGAGPLRAGSDELDQTIVVAQMQGEGPVAFAQRVLERIAGVERSQRHFQSAVISAGDGDDAVTLATRRSIALGFAEHARAHGMDELLLEASPAATQHARAELLGLVEEVWASSADKPVPVRLSFQMQPLRATA